MRSSANDRLTSLSENDQAMLTAIIGICVSLLLYAASEGLFIAVTTKRIRSLPAQWREHPALAPGYAATLETGASQILIATWQRRRTLIWFATALLGFAVLWMTGFSLAVQLALIVVLAGWVTSGNRLHRDNHLTRAATKHGLPARKRLGWRPELAWVGLRILSWLAFLGCACFIADALTRPLR